MPVRQWLDLGAHIAGVLLCGSLSVYFAYRAIRSAGRRGRKPVASLDPDGLLHKRGISPGFVFLLASVFFLLLTIMFAVVQI